MENKNVPGSPAQPIHIVTKTWEEETRDIQDHIIESKPLEGQYRTHLEGSDLFIPKELVDNLSAGGVITLNELNNIVIFGGVHWRLHQRLLAKISGSSPIISDEMRRTYTYMHKFSGLSQDCAITLPPKIIQDANIGSIMIMTGFMYSLEVSPGVLKPRKPSKKRGWKFWKR